MTDGLGTAPQPVATDDLMAEIRRQVRERRRGGALAGAGAADDFLDEAEETLIQAIHRRREKPRLLLEDLLGPDEEWRLATHLRMTSHRRLTGPLVLAVKRTLLMPIMRWLFEFTQTNFRRQRVVNESLFACLEELAIDNARLRRDLSRLEEAGTAAGGRPAPGDGSR